MRNHLSQNLAFNVHLLLNMTNHKNKLINTGNAYEQKARLEKAVTLFAALPAGFVGANSASRKACATLLRSWSQVDRNIFAIAAGCKNIPSTLAWELFAGMVEG